MLLVQLHAFFHRAPPLSAENVFVFVFVVSNHQGPPGLPLSSERFGKIGAEIARWHIDVHFDVEGRRIGGLTKHEGMEALVGARGPRCKVPARGDEKAAPTFLHGTKFEPIRDDWQDAITKLLRVVYEEGGLLTRCCFSA